MQTANLILNLIISGLIILALLVGWEAVIEGRKRGEQQITLALDIEEQARASRHAIKELTGAMNLREHESVILAASRLDEKALQGIGTPVPGRIGVRKVGGVEFYSAAWLNDKAEHEAAN